MQNWLPPSLYEHFFNLIWMVLDRGQPMGLQRGWPIPGKLLLQGLSPGTCPTIDSICPTQCVHGFCRSL